MPLPDRLQMYNLLQRLGPAEVFTPGFLRQVDQRRAAGRSNARCGRRRRRDHDLNRKLAFDWRYTLAENDLPKVCGTSARWPASRSASRCSMTRLLDFSLRLPTDYKLKGLKLRWFFKEALRGFLPDEILTKKKQGFGLPFGVWASGTRGCTRLADDSLRAWPRAASCSPPSYVSCSNSALPSTRATTARWCGS